MNVWILVVNMVFNTHTYTYNFLEKNNCQKVGKSIVSYSKKWHYYCKSKYVKIKN